MQEEAEAGVEEEDVVAAEEEGVLGDNVSQDYCFKLIRNLGLFFVQVLCVCQFLINISIGTELSVDYQIEVVVSVYCIHIVCLVWELVAWNTYVLNMGLISLSPLFGPLLR